MPASATERYVRAFLDQAHASGLRDVVVCPGSRSTPLTLALARHPSLRPWLHLDERSAGYFALGLARQTGRPVGLVCTSGTAAANFLPAAVEASLSRVPLLLLTADRPPELRDVGAAQTIDQLNLYGSHARWALDMPVTDGTEQLEDFARGVAARAVATSLTPPAGPVHLNFPFREPLVDRTTTEAPTPPRHGVASPPVQHPSETTVASLIESLSGRRGLIVCGPESMGLPAVKLAALGSALGWPVLADPLSGLRAGRHDLDGVVATYDALLRNAAFGAGHVPQAVLRLGAAPTSKALNVWLAGQRTIPHVVVDVAPSWREPDGIATSMVHADAEALCDALLSRLGDRDRAVEGWLSDWQSAERAASSALRDAIEALDEPFEGRAPLDLASALPEGATLVCGNSMPVRDIDSFFPRLERDVRVVGTRGASGIDGVVSSALGAAAARQGPVALLIGDLSFFHDLNGLWAARRHDLDLTVLLVNNDGGGIFHFLPQAELAPDAFEEWFGTPSGLDFRHAVELHGGRYARLEDPRGAAAQPLAEALARPGLDVLELRTDRVRNVELHRRVWAHVATALEQRSVTA
ncbi:MAG: 2-succinyl-5-enolpyruvyl-6-hydroxy-3-cyclohexene-1-carboxylic-acid synthase [Dehalococcoidia bacterium]